MDRRGPDLAHRGPSHRPHLLPAPGDQDAGVRSRQGPLGRGHRCADRLRALDSRRRVAAFDMSAIRLGTVDKWMWMGLMLLLGPRLLVVESAHGDLRPIRLLARARHVKTGTEKQTCFPITFPRDHEV